MTTAQISDPFTALADERVLADTIVALEEHGFGVEVVDDLASGSTVTASRWRMRALSPPMA
jgi:hypothetical protein